MGFRIYFKKHIEEEGKKHKILLKLSWDRRILRRKQVNFKALCLPSVLPNQINKKDISNKL